MLGEIEGRRRGVTEDKMVESYHQLNGHDFEQTPGDGEGQGSLAFNLSLIWSPAAFKLVYVLFTGPRHSLSLPSLSGTTICSKFILHFP